MRMGSGTSEMPGPKEVTALLVSTSARPPPALLPPCCCCNRERRCPLDCWYVLAVGRVEWGRVSGESLRQTPRTGSGSLPTKRGQRNGTEGIKSLDCRDV